MLTHLSYSKWKWTAGTWRSPNWTGKSSWNKPPLQEVRNNLQLQYVVFFLNLCTNTAFSAYLTSKISVISLGSDVQPFAALFKALKDAALVKTLAEICQPKVGRPSSLLMATRNPKANHLLDLENLVINGISTTWDLENLVNNGISTTSHLVQDFRTINSIPGIPSLKLSPLNRDHFKRTWIIFQPSFLRDLFFYFGGLHEWSCIKRAAQWILVS